MLEKLSERETQMWFYYTRGMIQGLGAEYKIPAEAQLQLIEQFNKIGPNLNINECDLKTRLI